MIEWEALNPEAQVGLVLGMSCRSCGAAPNRSCDTLTLGPNTWANVLAEFHQVRRSDARFMFLRGQELAKAMAEGRVIEGLDDFMPPPDLTCPYCGKFFPDPQELEEHEAEC